MSVITAILDMPPVVRAMTLAASLACALSMASIIRRSFASMSWPTAQGTIHVSEVRSASDSYKHHVVYTYHVSGREYTSTRLTVGGRRLREYPHNLADDVDAFRPGTSTRVYYDPANPHYAVLEPGPQLWDIAVLLVGIASAVAMSWRWLIG